MSSTWGRLFRISTWGESHGPEVGVVIDGCPPRLPLSEGEIQADLDLRRPGGSALGTARKEPDRVEIRSGVFNGMTTGAPIALVISSVDVRSLAYEPLKNLYRPGHADFTQQYKYGIRDWRGGGRLSARETASRVAAGAVARKLLRERCGLEVVAYVTQIGLIKARIVPEKVDRKAVYRNSVRCPDSRAAKKMREKIIALRRKGDSIGASLGFTAYNVPVGLGEPLFNKLDSDLAAALISIPAAKGFELGSGFAAVASTGSRNNDGFIIKDGRVQTATNRAGGVLGGISNGMPIVGRVAFKPTPTISRTQQTVTEDRQNVTFTAKGRHDPCVGPRAVPVVEAMVLLTLADHWLRHQALIAK